MGPSSQLKPPVWQIWWMAARPVTLLAAWVPVLVGTALALAAHRVQWLAAWLALAGALWIQIGTNFFNDYADYQKGADTAARLGPMRITQRGWVTPRTMLIASITAFALASVCGLYLIWLGGWPIIGIGVTSILAGLAYTGGPYPLGYHGLGEIFVFVFFGLVAVCGTFYVQAQRVDAACVIAAVAVGCLATALLVVNNLRDRHTDQIANKRTLAVRLGEHFARWEYACLVLVAYLCMMPMALWAGWGWLLPCLSAPWAIRAVVAVFRLDGAELNRMLFATMQLEAMFGVLLALGLVLQSLT